MLNWLLVLLWPLAATLRTLLFILVILLTAISPFVAHILRPKDREVKYLQPTRKSVEQYKHDDDDDSDNDDDHTASVSFILLILLRYYVEAHLPPQ